MDGIRVFLKRMLHVFFARVRPDSTVAKPRCMMNTRAVERSIHTLLTVNATSVMVGGEGCASCANTGLAMRHGKHSSTP